MVKQAREVLLKRAYEDPAAEDGLRVLVERLWPRGLTKERARVDLWLREIAPSPDLRTWYAHDQTRWEAFRARYLAELEDAAHRPALERLTELAREGTVTLVFAARDAEHSSAAVLADVLKGAA